MGYTFVGGLYHIAEFSSEKNVHIKYIQLTGKSAGHTFAFLQNYLTINICLPYWLN